MLLAHYPGQFPLILKLNVLATSGYGGRVSTYPCIGIQSYNKWIEECDICIDAEMKQVLNTTRCFHFAPCSTNNLVILSRRT